MKIHVAFLALLALDIVVAANLPSSWKTCKKSSPNFNSCLKDATTAAIKDLKKGNAELNLPVLDPIRLEKLTLKQGAGTAVGLTLNFKNLVIHGLSNGNIEKMSIDHNKHEISMEFHSRGLFKIEGDYTSKGRILLIPINGVGKSQLIFDNFIATVVLRCKAIKKDSQEFWDCQKADIDIGTSRLHMNFKRTQNVNEGLGTNLNTFLNENWKEILQDLKPAISKEFGIVIKNYANLLLSQVPINQISPS